MAEFLRWILLCRQYSHRWHRRKWQYIHVVTFIPCCKW